jgi:hypothetical protein
MLRRVCILLFAVLVILLTLPACVNAPTPPAAKTTAQPTGETYAPVFTPANFVATIDNAFLPFQPGTTFISEGTEDGAKAHREVSVTPGTQVILGVTCVVVRDRVWWDGHLAEDATAWYAQDKEGTVWYFGEEVKAYENGMVVSTQGSWQAGVNGAKPGIAMLGKPAPGRSYRQEYSKGQAEDMAEVVSLTEFVSVPYGSFGNTLKKKEWSSLEPGVLKYKYYARGIGWIMTTFEGKADQEKLVKITTGSAD